MLARVGAGARCCIMLVAAVGHLVSIACAMLADSVIPIRLALMRREFDDMLI